MVKPHILAPLCWYVPWKRNESIQHSLSIIRMVFALKKLLKKIEMYFWRNVIPEEEYIVAKGTIRALSGRIHEKNLAEISEAKFGKVSEDIKKKSWKKSQERGFLNKFLNYFLNTFLKEFLKNKNIWRNRWMTSQRNSGRNTLGNPQKSAYQKCGGIFRKTNPGKNSLMKIPKDVSRYFWRNF